MTVLPKVTPEGVTVLKDSDKQELEKAIKEQAEKAANNVKGLPSGVTVTVTEVKQEQYHLQQQLVYKSQRQ